MQKPFACFFMFTCLALVVVSAPAQISITASDVGATLTVGSTTTAKTDTGTHSFDIGTLGSTSWDASALGTAISASATSVVPDTTPYFSTYSTATHTQRTAISGVTYTYYKLGTDLVYLGVAATSSFFTSVTKKNPGEVTYQLPMTLGTTWTTTSVDTTTTNFPPFPPTVTVTHQSVTSSVDAYGSLKMPGGAVFAALRLRTDRHSTTGTTTFRSIYYNIITKNGASLGILPADTLQPNTGVINISSISWTQPVVTDVQSSLEIPAEFSLAQNYPNPFNPTTTIRFDLAKASSVSLKVFNLLGQEVATLLEGERAAGSYRVEWDASTHADGVYFYRLQAGSNVETKTLMLMK